MLLGLLLLVLRVCDLTDDLMLPPFDTQNVHSDPISWAAQEGSR